MNCDQLSRFRQAAYDLLSGAKDATFELMDAVLTTRNASSLADLSLSPMFRRQWSSVYEALQDTRPNRDKLMRLYIEHLPLKENLVFAIDHTAWSRPYSKTLKERTYEHQPSTSGKVAIGQGYSTPAYSGRGRPRQHGNKFKLNDFSTWWEPNQSLKVHDAQWGTISIKRWDELHFRRSCAQTMNLILVERIESTASGKKLKPLWLVWIGQTMPRVETLWKHYLRRFCVDHWYRFLKQRLHWTLPHLSTPQQCERWSDLMPLITWQLWLARELVKDRHLP